MSGRASTRQPVVKLRRGPDGTSANRRPDTIAGEEPLEIRVNGEQFVVTMRTPGNDFELAAGFLLGEGVVAGRDDIAQIGYGPGVDEHGRATYNIVDVQLAAGIAPPAAEEARRVYTSSSCGVCGTSSIELVHKNSRFSPAEPAPDGAGADRITLERLLALPEELRQQQRLFASTGGVHAAGIFPLADAAAPLVVREDVGRHNAVDKAIGRALLNNQIPLRHTVLQVSGRASFELVQKAAMVGIPMLAAVSAPSSLAIDLAKESGMTLAGFSRTDSVVLYTGAERVQW
ncbi:formate dehydrogenase accessory sulfurtransferase FdhD [Nakamurella aerolata]|uniref:formate dehydrogenase accessory sulfurtransferase FdhD n=1 Tax=Nakamurella aerolata TaxID=1656892 RepID=UPI001BB19632